MKRIVNAVIIYLASCALGTLLGAVFCMLCMNVTNLVVGTRLPLWVSPLFIKGLFLSFPLASVVALLLVLLHQIRHNSRSVPLFTVYFALTLLSWGLLMPQALRLSLAYDMRLGMTKTIVSPGYFRESGGLVYYWARLDDDGTGDGLCINLHDVNGNAVSPLHHAELPQQGQSLFADTLVATAITPPQVVRSPLAVYLYVLYQARDAASRDYFAWLAFASMGMALLAVYALGGVSSWRLQNAFIVMLAGVGIMFLNYALYASERLAPFARLWSQKLGAAGELVPLATAVNVVVALLFVLTGVVARFVRRRAASYGAETGGAA